MTRGRWTSAVLGALLALTAIGAPVAAQEGIHLEQGAADDAGCHALEVWNGDAFVFVIPADDGPYGSGGQYCATPGVSRSLPNGNLVFEWTIWGVGRLVSSAIQVWATDGTSDGTFMAARLCCSWFVENDWQVIGRTAYIYRSPDVRGLVMTRGSRASTHAFRAYTCRCGDNLHPLYLRLGGRVYFVAKDPFTLGSERGQEVWVSDGTRRGTHVLKEIGPGWTGSHPDGLAYTTPEGLEPTGFVFTTTIDHRTTWWVSDGTRKGTHRITAP